jgi:K+-sensing histidine kinase KdpD
MSQPDFNSMPAIPPFQPQAPVFERGLWSRAWFIVLLCLALAAVDWELIPLKVFPFVFIFPLMLAAWNGSLPFAFICAVGLSLTRLAHQFVFDERPYTVDELADALVRFFVLLLLAALTGQLGRQARQLRHRVRLLEGILPICAWCKNIRDEHNNWVQLEGYITEHSEAHFSHSLCPECYEKYSGQKPPAGSLAEPPAK